MEVLLLEMENSLRLEVVTSVRPEAVVDLYMDAGWWEEGWSEDVIPAMVANSFRFVALFDGSELVGMGRALSDGVSGQGWGKKIVSRLVKELRAVGIDWIGLVGAPGTQAFYEKLGFSEMPQFVPMKYQC